MRQSALAGPWLWAAPLAWMAVIFALSAQSTLPHLPGAALDLQDIAGHFCEYGLLAVLWWLALRSAGARRPVLWTLLVVMLYAASDEYHQSFVAGRHSDPLDWLVDAFGACFALALLHLPPARRLLALIPCWLARAFNRRDHDLAE